MNRRRAAGVLSLALLVAALLSACGATGLEPDAGAPDLDPAAPTFDQATFDASSWR